MKRRYILVLVIILSTLCTASAVNELIWDVEDNPAFNITRADADAVNKLVEKAIGEANRMPDGSRLVLLFKKGEPFIFDSGINICGTKKRLGQLQSTKKIDELETRLEKVLHPERFPEKKPEEMTKKELKAWKGEQKRLGRFSTALRNDPKIIRKNLAREKRIYAETSDNLFLAPPIEGARRIVFRGGEKTFGKMVKWIFDQAGVELQETRNFTFEYLHITPPEIYKYEGDVVDIKIRQGKEKENKKGEFAQKLSAVVTFRLTPGFARPESTFEHASVGREQTWRRVLGDPLNPEPDVRFGKMKAEDIRPADGKDLYEFNTGGNGVEYLNIGDHLAFKLKGAGSEAFRLVGMDNFTLDHCRFSKYGGRIVKSRDICDGMVITHNTIDRAVDKPIDTDGDGIGDRVSMYASGGGGFMINYGGHKGPLIAYNTIYGTSDDCWGLRLDEASIEQGLEAPGLLFKGNYIENAHGDCIILRDTRHAVFEDNVFFRNRQAAMRTDDKTVTTDRHIVFRNNVIIEQPGIAVTGTPRHGEESIVRDFDIYGNTFIGLQRSFLKIGHCEEIQFHDNTIRSYLDYGEMATDLQPPAKLGVGMAYTNSAYLGKSPCKVSGGNNTIIQDVRRIPDYSIAARGGIQPGKPLPEYFKDVTLEYTQVDANFEFDTIEASGQWQEVKLLGKYKNPVIVATPVCPNQPLVAKVKDAGASSFKVCLQGSGNVVGKVCYIVLEEGAYRLPNGKAIEARRIKAAGTEPKKVVFKNKYENPVVLAQEAWATPDGKDSCLVGRRNPGSAPVDVIVVDSFSDRVGGVDMKVLNLPVEGTTRYTDMEQFLYTPDGAILTGSTDGSWPVLTGQYPIRRFGITIGIAGDQSTQKEQIGMFVFSVKAPFKLEEPK